MSAPKKNNPPYNIISFLLFLAALYVCFYIMLNLKPSSDDTVFLAAATSGISPLDYLSQRYATWTGRIAIEGIMFTTIATSAFWKLMIPTCLLLTAYTTWKSFLSDRLSYSLGIPLCLFCLLAIDHAVLDASVFYVTGFYNYLLPASCGLFACAIFVSPLSFSIPEKTVALPLTFIASQSEQVGLAMAIIFVASLIYERKSAKIYRATLLLIVITGFTLLVTAPGNYARLATETMYMPEFAEYSLLRKILNGFDVFNAHYINPANLYPKAIATLLLLLTTNKSFVLKRTALTLAIIGILQGSLFSTIFTTDDAEHYSIQFLNSGLGLEYFFSYTLSIASLTSIIYIMKRTIEDCSRFYFGTLLLLLHVVITTAVGLSPTAYESGYRTLLTGDVVSLMLICLLLRSVPGWPERPNSRRLLETSDNLDL